MCSREPDHDAECPLGEVRNAARDAGCDPWSFDWHCRRAFDAALSFPDKRTALLAAFSSRFSLGFFAATINVRMSPITAGVLVGLLTSIPDAIVTKAYVPILITGVIFGAAAGWIVGRWAASF